MLQTSTNWQYDQTIDKTKFFGFVYLITHKPSGRMYVGRKYLTSKKGKTRIASKWESYWGSCAELLEHIKAEGKDSFERRILTWCETRSEINYEEVAEQIRRDVLKAVLPDGSRAYYNRNILSRWFVSANAGAKPGNKNAAGNRGGVQSPDHVAKRTQSRRDSGGMARSAVTRQKQSATMTGRESPKRGIKHSDEARANMKEAAIKRETLKSLQKPVELPVPCGVAECLNDRKVKSSGYCALHHNRFRKHGDPLVVKTADRSSPEVREIMAGARREWWAKQRDAMRLNIDDA